MGSMFSPSGTQTGAQQGALGAAGSLSSAGRGLMTTGMGALNPAVSYYKSLLGGPAAAQAAVAPAARNISDAYSGAAAGVKAGYQQGTARDTTLGGLTRDRTTAISGLYQGVQPGAAAALGSLGTTATGQGIGAFTGAGGINTGVANTALNSSLGFGQLGLGAGGGIGQLLSQGLKTGLKIAGAAA